MKTVGYYLRGHVKTVGYYLRGHVKTVGYYLRGHVKTVGYYLRGHVKTVGYYLRGHVKTVGYYLRFVCLLVGCLTSQQHASVSQGRICSRQFTCCHTEIEAADQTSTSPSHSILTPGRPVPALTL